jgi:hypothetical protein
MPDTWQAPSSCDMVGGQGVAHTTDSALVRSWLWHLSNASEQILIYNRLNQLSSFDIFFAEYYLHNTPLHGSTPTLIVERKIFA